ncbi:MAG: hypothetical protein JWP87_2369 [Labilithrix sp.]|nr:hypothetical protein [Labilithrix sp.]
MRLSSLVSVACLSGLFFAFGVSNANAAPARVSKRGAPPRVLPAPLPKPEPVAVTALPQLPPAELSATSYAPVTTTSADVPNVEVVTAPPPPVALAAPPAHETIAPKTPAPSVAAGVKPSGFVLQFGSGLLAPATGFAAHTSTVAPGLSFEARLGLYVSPHVGILGGFRGSYGHSNGMCSSADSCKGYSMQAPVLLQFAHKDRAHGLYGEIGVGLATKFGGFGDGYSFALSSPAELKLGMGYRIAGSGDVALPATLDMAMGLDVGEMTQVEAQVGTTKLKADIAERTTHVIVALSLIAHFSL